MEEKGLIILQENGRSSTLRGISVQDFKSIFDELDTDGSGELDWMPEFKNALSGLGIRLPIKVRNLFEALDDDSKEA